RIEGLSPEEPYISHLNESALQVLNFGGAASKASVEGGCFPPRDPHVFPETRRRVETIQSRYTATEGKSPEIFLAS
ncbi:MAG: hypothetical protein ACE5HR_05455, partial [bacterium]